LWDEYGYFFGVVLRYQVEGFNFSVIDATDYGEVAVAAQT